MQLSPGDTIHNDAWQNADGMLIAEGGLLVPMPYTHCKKCLGTAGALTSTYISGPGVSGTANKAMPVLTRILKADSLQRLGDRIKIQVYFATNSSGPITVTCKLNDVTICDTSHVGVNLNGLLECDLHYIDNTHCHVIEYDSGSIGSLTAPRVSGFLNDTDQNITIVQSAAAGNYITCYGIFVDLLPLAT